MMSEETIEVSQVQRHSFKALLLLTVAGLLAAALCVGCASQPQPAANPATPSATVESFVEALNAMDVDAAVDCCDSQVNSLYDSANGIASGILSGMGIEINPETIIKALSPSMADLLASPSGGSTTMNLVASNLKETVSGNNATVTGDWTLTVTRNGKEQTQTAPFEFKLVKEDGQWKLSFADEISKGLDALRQ